MHLFTFIGINVMLTVIITVVLFDMSRPPISDWIHSPILDSLTTYYKNRSITQIAISTGLTKTIILLCSMLISFFAFRFSYPRTAIELVYFYCIVFPISFIVAYLLRYVNLEDDLESYYEKMNPGIASGIHSLLTVSMTYVFMKFFLSFLCKYFFIGSHSMNGSH